MSDLLNSRKVYRYLEGMVKAMLGNEGDTVIECYRKLIYRAIDEIPHMNIRETWRRKIDKRIEDILEHG